MKLVHHAEEQLKAGILPAVQTYEDIPYMEQMEERIVSGVAHLRSIVAELQAN